MHYVSIFVYFLLSFVHMLGDAFFALREYIVDGVRANGRE